MSRITPPSGGVEYQFERFTASGTWNKPDDITWVLVSVVGGGGGGGADTSGGGGAHMFRRLPAKDLPSSVSVTVGSGGGIEGDGGTSKFGDYALATGGKYDASVGGGGQIVGPSADFSTEISANNENPAIVPYHGGGPDADSAIGTPFGAGGGSGSYGDPGSAGAPSGYWDKGGGSTGGAAPDAPTDLGAAGGGAASDGGVPGGGGGDGSQGGRGEVRVWAW
jgi:hypothetical protein